MGIDNTFATGDEKGIDTILSEHPEVRILWEKRTQLPGPVDINGVNPILHVMLEATVENQLRTGEIPEVCKAFERLEGTGLSRHAARGVIAQVLTSFFFDILKNHLPFDKEKYISQLNLLGIDFEKIGRNQPCPCGSGIKFKRCCQKKAEDIQVSPMTGRLVLGRGSYFTHPDVYGIDGPLDPIYQLENRVHISRYLTGINDIEGAVQVLKENIDLAESIEDSFLLKNALYDTLNFCLKNKLLGEGMKVIDKMLPLLSDNEKGCILCDKADILAQGGQVDGADRIFEDVFETLPDWHFGRYRYALHLEETGRKDQAKKILQDLVDAEEKIDSETYRAASEVLKNFDF